MAPCREASWLLEVSENAPAGMGRAWPCKALGWEAPGVGEGPAGPQLSYVAPFPEGLAHRRRVRSRRPTHPLLLQSPRGRETNSPGRGVVATRPWQTVTLFWAAGLAPVSAAPQLGTLVREVWGSRFNQTQGPGPSCQLVSFTPAPLAGLAVTDAVVRQRVPPLGLVAELSACTRGQPVPVWAPHPPETLARPLEGPPGSL